MWICQTAAHSTVEATTVDLMGSDPLLTVVEAKHVWVLASIAVMKGSDPIKSTLCPAGSDEDSMRPVSAKERRPAGFLTASRSSSGLASVPSVQASSDVEAYLRRSIAMTLDWDFVYEETMS